MKHLGGKWIHMSWKTILAFIALGLGILALVGILPFDAVIALAIAVILLAVCLIA